MTYVGSWKIDDALTFYANTTRVDTGAATDADSAPTYRVYEDETGTAILNGSMALLDSSNTAGFYSEQITLSAANGFEKGKCYAIYIQATVNSIVGATHRTFQIQAEVAVASYNTGLTPLQAGTVVEGTTTVVQSLRLNNAAQGAKLSGAATTNVIVRDLADSKNRIDATVDADGNRTAVTLDLT